MDRFFGAISHPHGCIKPETLIAYGAVTVVISVVVNWAMSMLLLLLKPFTCAAILMAFIRPDLAQNFLQEEYLKLILEKSNVLFFGFLDFVIRLGEQFHEKFK